MSVKVRAGELHIEGLDALKATFNSISNPSEDKAMQRSMLKAVNVVRAAVKSLAPVRTGNLRDSIISKIAPRKRISEIAGFVTIDRKKLKVPTQDRGKTKYAKTNYPFYVEFGSKHVPARPYFRPGVQKSHAMASSIIVKAMQDFFKRKKV